MDGEQTTGGIELPELGTLDDKGLARTRDKIAQAFTRLNDKERVGAEDLAEMAALADQMDQVNAETTAREAAQADAQNQRASLAARMAGEGSEDADAEGVEAVEADNEGETVGDVAGEGDESAGAIEEDAPVEAMAASAAGRKSTVKGGFKVSPRKVASTAVEEKGSHLSIIASSGVPGIDTGKVLDRDGLSEALHERARMMENGSPRALVASIRNNAPKNDVRKVTDDTGIRSAWDKAHDVDSLVASGGWCAPSETVYDFACDFEAMPEALDLPSITANRGGVRYPSSPLLADVFNDVNSGFTWTEADDIAAATPGGPTKPCFTIPCPDFLETRLQAQGICVTAGNLTDRAFPELTNRYVDLVMTAHAHRMNGLTIAKVVAASTAQAVTLDADLGATESILGALEFVIAQKRDQFFMAEGQTLEGFAPRWVRHLIRRDLARRAGVAFQQITNADITTYLADIGVRLQFVSNYQVLADNATAWPTTVDIVLYPAGAHTRLDGGSLDLGVVRDSTLNATNDYTAAWTEEFWGVVSRCFSVIVTVPICATGLTGGPALVTCPTA